MTSTFIIAASHIKQDNVINWLKYYIIAVLPKTFV